MDKLLPHPLIKRVVVLMLENRGFDHLMGWLYSLQDNPNIITRQGDGRPFIGLSTVPDLDALKNPSPVGDPLPIRKGARSPKTPSYNTGESFAHIMNQMWGVALNDAVWKDREQRERLIDQISHQGQLAPPMNGYVLDYNQDVYHHVGVRLGERELGEVLDTYTPEQLPVISGLARYYAVSDEWFCSVPSQTNTNRAFSMSGTSRGMVNNSFYDPPTWNPGVKIFSKLSPGEISNADALPITTRSLFEVLEQNNCTWKVYWQDTWPPRDVSLGMEWQYTRTMFPFLADSQFDPNFEEFDASNPQNGFFAAARAGQLPAVSWIEPKWGGGQQWNTVFRAVGNDYHPVSDTTTGEDFVMNVYNALAANEAFANTLLVITFDENGGTYDHVVPPLAAPSGNDACPLPQPKIPRGDMDAETRTQYGFGFGQFGVRVPTLLISPRVPQGTIFRSTTDTPYDHTSLIATILKLAGIDETKWQMGDRVANAPTFENVANQDPPRVIPEPTAALTIGPRPVTESVKYNMDYLLEYKGDLWYDKPGSRFLGPSSGLSKSGHYYPTMVDERLAIPFRFVPLGGGDAVSPIFNMSLLGIKTTEQAIIGLRYFTVSSLLSSVFYGRSIDGPEAQWQVRILSSRDRREEVRLGEDIYILSQLGPNIVQSASRRTRPDPLQRLVPLPGDPGEPTYVTTRAAEWGVWRIRPIG
ncbi:hypothetical protein C5708_08900 [Caulobacter sp. CCUG 60055]|nr:alkaline phosphatase family protein [Caulobacter sp. CCUG 60055]MCI3180370.1 hypothetical protein [Caulobacter sp. CCUG 60055]